jgi:hypothetical protein
MTDTLTSEVVLHARQMVGRAYEHESSYIEINRESMNLPEINAALMTLLELAKAQDRLSEQWTQAVRREIYALRQ